MIYDRNPQDRALDVAFCYGGWDRALPSGIQYGPIIRDIYIVECCTGGKGGVIINGNHFPIKGGDCYLLRPGDTIIHQADYHEPRTGVWCGIYGLAVASAFARARITDHSPFAPPEAFAGIFRETAALVNGFSDPDGGAPLRCRAHIYGILGELLRFIPDSPRGSTSVERALQMIEACYHETLTVERMAHAAGLERCYFSMQFKQVTGQAPHRYLMALRIKKACALIRDGNFSMATIAAAVGISPENFARLFRKEMGMTPLEYRRKQQR